MSEITILRELRTMMDGEYISLIDVVIPDFLILIQVSISIGLLFITISSRKRFCFTICIHDEKNFSSK